MDLNLIQRLASPADTKIVLLVVDGLGGLPAEPRGSTELEAAGSTSICSRRTSPLVATSAHSDDEGRGDGLSGEIADTDPQETGGSAVLYLTHHESCITGTDST